MNSHTYDASSAGLGALAAFSEMREYRQAPMLGQERLVESLLVTLQTNRSGRASSTVGLGDLLSATAAQL